MAATAAAVPECGRAARGSNATSVWGSLLPARFAGKKPSSERGGAAGAALLDAPTAAEPRSASGASTPTSTSEPAAGDAPLDFGYPRGLEKKYRVARELGRGGNGVVYVAEELATGAEFALKSIPKVLTDPKLSET